MIFRYFLYIVYLFASVTTFAVASTQTGVLTRVIGDQPGHNSQTHYYLQRSNNTSQALDLPTELKHKPSKLASLIGKSVVIELEQDALTSQTQGSFLLTTSSSLAVKAIYLAEQTTRAQRAVALPAAKLPSNALWITLMCKFSDINTEPQTLEYFTQMYDHSEVGLKKYWSELSYEKLSLAGSTAAGWFQLPQPRSYYVYTPLGESTEKLDFDRASDDCANAAIDSGIDISQYDGLNLAFNANLDSFVWGGTDSIKVNGENQVFGITWLAPWGYKNISVVEHEMGHGFGLLHSSGMNGYAYDNVWDIMSGNTSGCFWFTVYTTPYRCLGQHTISHHKRQLGWISDAQNHIAQGGSETLTLNILSQKSSTGLLMATIPLADNQHFYTIETRAAIGFDSKLPTSKAIIIHEVDTTRQRPAHVVDQDNDGDTSDDGAQWLPGETFIDSGNGIQIEVLKETSDGLQIHISSRQRAPNIPDAINASDSQYTDHIALTWSLSSLADNYQVFRCTSNLSDTCALLGSSTQPHFDDYTVTSTDVINYRIKACSTNQCSSYSSNAQGSLKPLPIATPDTINASDGLYTNHIKLTWSPVSLAEIYQVFRCTTPSSTSCTLIYYSIPTQFSDYFVPSSGLTNYRIKACSHHECSSYSSNAQGFLKPTQQIDAPNNATASDGLYTDHIALSWNPNNLADKYLIYRCTSSSSTSCTLFGSSTHTQFDDYTVSNLGITHYRIKACINEQCSPYSNNAPGSLKPLNIAAPSTVNASDGLYRDYIALTWSPSTLAETYQVYRCSSTSSATCALLGNSTQTQFNDDTATSTSVAHYRIKACANNQCSPYSSNAEGRLKPQAISAPNTVSASDGTSNTHIQVNWQAISAASYYELYQCGSDNINNCHLLLNSTETTAFDTEANVAVAYFYRVKACTNTECSGFSTADKGHRASPELEAPLLTTIINNHTDHITLDWGSITHASFYEVLRCQSFILNNCTPIAQALRTHFSDFDISPNTYYFYLIKACNTAKCSINSNLAIGSAEADVTSPSNPAPPTKKPAPPPKKPDNTENTIHTIITFLLIN